MITVNKYFKLVTLKFIIIIPSEKVSLTTEDDNNIVYCIHVYRIYNQAQKRQITTESQKMCP